MNDLLFPLSAAAVLAAATTSDEIVAIIGAVAGLMLAVAAVIRAWRAKEGKPNKCEKKDDQEGGGDDEEGEV